MHTPESLIAYLLLAGRGDPNDVRPEDMPEGITIHSSDGNWYVQRSATDGRAVIKAALEGHAGALAFMRCWSFGPRHAALFVENYVLGNDLSEGTENL